MMGSFSIELGEKGSIGDLLPVLGRYMTQKGLEPETVTLIKLPDYLDGVWHTGVWAVRHG